MAPRKLAMYRAVFFDLDDTIFDFGQCSRQAFSRPADAVTGPVPRKHSPSFNA